MTVASFILWGHFRKIDSDTAHCCARKFSLFSRTGNGNAMHREATEYSISQPLDCLYSGSHGILMSQSFDQIRMAYIVARTQKLRSAARP